MCLRIFHNQPGFLDTRFQVLRGLPRQAGRLPVSSTDHGTLSLVRRTHLPGLVAPFPGFVPISFPPSGSTSGEREGGSSSTNLDRSLSFCYPLDRQAPAFEHLNAELQCLTTVVRRSVLSVVLRSE